MLSSNSKVMNCGIIFNILFLTNDMSDIVKNTSLTSERKPPGTSEGSSGLL